MLQRLLTTFVAVLTLSLLVLGNAQAATDPFQSVCQDTVSNQSAVCTTTTPKNSNPLAGPDGLLGKITRVVALVGGIAAVIVVMVGSFMYITSGGDPQKANSARNAVLFALIGLVIIIVAQALIVFVLGKL